MKTIAFLGIGTMGKYIAANLAKSKKFKQVNIWNRNPLSAGIKYAAQFGAIPFLTIYETVKDADFVCICVSDAYSVSEILFSEDGAIRYIKKGAIVLDFSTIDSDATIEIANKLLINGIHFFDAPLSGGDTGARDAKLTIMVGASQNNLLDAIDIFESIGQNTFFCGSIGKGQILKSINQIMCAINMVSLSEAFRFAKFHDISFDNIIEVCSTGAAGSWALSNLGKRIVEEDFQNGFLVKHMIKDILIAKKTLPAEYYLDGLEYALKMFQKTELLGTKAGEKLATQAMYLTYSQN